MRQRALSRASMSLLLLVVWAVLAFAGAVAATRRLRIV